MKVKIPGAAYIVPIIWIALFFGFIWGMVDQGPIFYPLALVAFVGVIFSTLSIAIGHAAAKKGRSFWAFYWLSVLVSPIIIGIVIAAMKPLDSTELGNTRKCPKCAEHIKSEASVCRYCGHEFSTT